jgi:hypothetical protein
MVVAACEAWLWIFFKHACLVIVGIIEDMVLEKT